jgi:alcohol dehydrogenase
MEQLFYIEPRRVEWRDIPQPKLADAQDALVRPITVATCDIDTGLIHGLVPFPGPFPLGHEGVGEVIEIGSNVTRITVGQRVIIPFQISCGTCARCQRGLTASCKSVNPGAMYGLEPLCGPWGGFLSDVVRVPWADHMLVPLPDGVDPVSVASLSDNVLDGWRTVAPFVTDPPNTSLLVVGGAAPSVQFYTIAVARALGVGRIDYVGSAESGAGADLPEKASRIGANVIKDPDDVRNGNYTITVCSSSEPEALRFALHATEPDGTCVANIISFQGDVPLPMLSMYTRGVRLVTGRVNARAVLPTVLDLVVTGALQPEGVTDAVVAWSDAADALVAEPQKLVFQR